MVGFTGPGKRLHWDSCEAFPIRAPHHKIPSCSFLFLFPLPSLLLTQTLPSNNLPCEGCRARVRTSHSSQNRVSGGSVVISAARGRTSNTNRVMPSSANPTTQRIASFGNLWGIAGTGRRAGVGGRHRRIDPSDPPAWVLTSTPRTHPRGG